MGKREKAEQGIVNYIGVPSVHDYMERVKKLGGRVIMAKTAVPRWDYLAIRLTQKAIPSGFGRKTETLNKNLV